MIGSSRYKWLMDNGKRLGLIIMEEIPGAVGARRFRLPTQYRKIAILRGITMPDADYGEAAAWLEKKCAAIGRRPEERANV